MGYLTSPWERPQNLRERSAESRGNWTTTTGPTELTMQASSPSSHPPLWNRLSHPRRDFSGILPPCWPTGDPMGQSHHLTHTDHPIPVLETGNHYLLSKP